MLLDWVVANHIALVDYMKALIRQYNIKISLATFRNLPVPVTDSLPGDLLTRRCIEHDAKKVLVDALVAESHTFPGFDYFNVDSDGFDTEAYLQNQGNLVEFISCLHVRTILYRLLSHNNT